MARPKSEDPVVFIKVGLRRSEWAWLALWLERDASPTRQLSEMVSRAMRFWPKGPNVVGHAVKAPRHRAPQALRRFAAERGLTRSEALAYIAKIYLEDHPEVLE